MSAFIKMKENFATLQQVRLEVIHAMEAHPFPGWKPIISERNREPLK